MEGRGRFAISLVVFIALTTTLQVSPSTHIHITLPEKRSHGLIRKAAGQPDIYTFESSHGRTKRHNAASHPLHSDSGSEAAQKPFQNPQDPANTDPPNSSHLPTPPTDPSQPHWSQAGDEETPPSSTRKKARIAMAITVTSCGPYIDYAIALRESIRTNFARSRFEVDYIAFLYDRVEDLSECKLRLETMGYSVSVKPIPVVWAELPEGEYKDTVNGSASGLGMPEFLKLYAYTMTEYHRVAILDLDLIVAQNFDEVFEIESSAMSAVGVWGNWDVEVIQAGFLCIKPNLQVFHQLLEIIRSATFSQDGSGWNNSRWGATYGGETVSGLLPYFYKVKRPSGFLHINHCIYNTQMVGNCETTGIEHIKFLHFTGCGKPMRCSVGEGEKCEWAHSLWWEYLWRWQDRGGVVRTPRCVEGREGRDQGTRGMIDVAGWSEDKRI